MKDIEENVEWIGIIKDLFDFVLSEKEENKRKYDNYIYSTFKCFVEHKKKLVFNMFQLRFCNIDFINMIMGGWKKIDDDKDIV